jgi:hypothetical protein
VPGREDDGAVRVARHRPAVLGHPQDLPAERVLLLRALRDLRVAGPGEQQAVRAEGQPAAVVRAGRRDAGDDRVGRAADPA